MQQSIFPDIYNFQNGEINMKLVLTFTLILMQYVISVSIGIAGDRMGPRPENLPLRTGEEQLEDAHYVPSIPQVITSPGIMVGTTQYDYQSNGSSGNRCAVDSDGGIHITWMNGISYPDERDVFYNYIDNNGNSLGPTAVSQVNGAGYCQIAVASEDQAAIAYHSSQNPSIENYVTLAIDQFQGFGIFQYFDPPDFLAIRCYWPYLSIDQNGYIHIVSAENPPDAGDFQALSYTNSTDAGMTWAAIVTVDTLETLSQNVVSSPVSDKSAIVYNHPLNYDTQWQNDVYYIESQDGLTWDWGFGKINVTGYGPPDSLYSYTDLDAIYDYNDNLHVIWNAQWVTNENVYYKTFLYHYDRDSGVITEMHSTIDNWIPGCEVGVWNRPVCKMTLARCTGADGMAAVYTAFDTSDCSAGGYANGEIYMQYSSNGGSSWENPVNLTNSPTPGCVPGNCESDHWSSAADIIHGGIHIMYVEDHDAGGIPQTEGQVTDNIIRYLDVEGPWCPTGIDDDENMPVTFSLAQNYPNPFNAATNISFELGADMRLELSVYDITGGKVATLVDGIMEAGRHSVDWNADDFASGVYFYRLNTESERSTRKMTLLK
jgi:hypothetical protein